MKVMIFAAGRGDRMRPLTDTTPKPLLQVGGKPLIVWTIERLVAAGFTDILINHAWLGAQIEAALGDGAQWGARLSYSAEGTALETAGGIAKALLQLKKDATSPFFLAVSGDIYTDFPYENLRNVAARMNPTEQPLMHLVMVPNPDFHPNGDFALQDDRLSLKGAPRYTFGNIGVYDTRTFSQIMPGTKMSMSPLYRDAIVQGCASGELYEGTWHNIGTPAQLAELDALLKMKTI